MISQKLLSGSVREEKYSPTTIHSLNPKKNKYVPDQNLITRLQEAAKLEETFPGILAAEEREIVLVMGCTGSGKSVSVNYLLGADLEPEFRKTDRIKNSPVKAVLTEKIDGPEPGDSLESKTLAPDVYPKQTSKEYTLALIALGTDEKISPQKIQEFLKENKKLKGNPVLIKQEDKFTLYSLSEQSEWKPINGLDASKFKALKFGQPLNNLKNKLDLAPVKTKGGGDCERLEPSYKDILLLPSHKLPKEVYEEITSKKEINFISSHSDLSYCDCPGFMDNRGKAEKIFTTISNHMVIKFAKNIRAILIVIEYNAFTTQRAASFRDLVKSVKKFIMEPSQVADSIFVAISKVPLDSEKNEIIEEVSESIEKILEERTAMFKKYAEKKIDSTEGVSDAYLKPIKELERECELLSVLKSRMNQLIVLNVFDKNSEKREAIINTLRQATGIPKKYFRFNEKDLYHIYFDEMVAKLLNDFLPIINEYTEFLRKKKLYEDKIKQLEENRDSLQKDIKTIPNEISAQVEHTFNRLIENSEDDLKKNEAEAAALRSQQDALQKEIGELKKSVEDLDRDDPIIYMTLSVDEKRSTLPVIKQLGRTVKKLKYSGMPFNFVDMKCDIESGRFDETTSENETGFFVTQYISKYGKDGIATVDIYVPKNQKDDNMKAIAFKKGSIRTKQEILENSEKDLQKVKEDQKRIENELIELKERKSDTDIRRNKIEEYKSKITIRLDTLNKQLEIFAEKIRELNAASVNNRLDYVKNQKLIEIIQQLVEKFYYKQHRFIPIVSEDKVKEIVISHDIIGIQFTHEKGAIAHQLQHDGQLVATHLDLTKDELRSLYTGIAKDNAIPRPLIEKIKFNFQSHPLVVTYLTALMQLQLEMKAQRYVPPSPDELKKEMKEQKYSFSSSNVNTFITSISSPTPFELDGEETLPPSHEIMRLDFDKFFSKRTELPIQQILKLVEMKENLIEEQINKAWGKSDDPLNRLIIDSVKEMAISGYNSGSESIKLKRKYYQHISSDEKHIPHWQKFAEELRKNAHINQYIEKNHILDAKANTRDKFYDVLDQSKGELYLKIISNPTLFKAFRAYNDCYNPSFAWADRLSVSGIKVNYCDFILRKSSPIIFPSELAVLSHLLKINIVYDAGKNTMKWSTEDSTGTISVAIKFQNEQIELQVKKKFILFTPKESVPKKISTRINKFRRG